MSSISRKFEKMKDNVCVFLASGYDWGDNGRKSCRSNKEEFCDPTIYFSMVISSKVEPQEIIECMTHEWACLNGTQLQIKDLQFIERETAVTFFKVSTATFKDVILAELSKILIAAQGMVEADSMDLNDYDFLIDVEVPLSKTLPAMNLRIQNAKLKVQKVAIFDKLSHQA